MASNCCMFGMNGLECLCHALVQEVGQANDANWKLTSHVASLFPNRWVRPVLDGKPNGATRVWQDQNHVEFQTRIFKRLGLWTAVAANTPCGRNSNDFGTFCFSQKIRLIMFFVMF